MAPAAKLPTQYRGRPREVLALTPERRAALGLSTPDTIVEVVGDQALVEEAVAYARRKRLVGFDLETTGLSRWQDDIILVQIGDAERQYLIWYQTIDPAPITALLADPAVCKAGVNLKFDLGFWLAKHGLTARAWNVADAQLVQQVLGCGVLGNVGMTMRATGMGQMAFRWLGLTLDKDVKVRTGWGDMTPGVWPGELGARKRFYAADDVIMPLKLLALQKPWIKQLGLAETVQLEHAFLPVLAEIETRGIRIDMDQWRALSDEAFAKRREAERALDAIFDVTTTYRIGLTGSATLTRDKNYASNDQLKDLIREYMWRLHRVDVISTNAHLKESLLRCGRLDPVKVEALMRAEEIPDPAHEGKVLKVGFPAADDLVTRYWKEAKAYLSPRSFRLPDTDSKTLKLLQILHETPDVEVESKLPTAIGLPTALVQPIVDHRDGGKRAGTYGENWMQHVSPATGRVHPDYVQAALSTGRLSNTPNTMNPPTDQRYRACFVPAPGYKYIGRDWSQIEPRVIAQYSQDPTYMRVFWSERPGTAGFARWCAGVTEPLDLYVEVGKNIGVIPRHFTIAMCKGDETATPEGKKGRKQSKVAVLGLGYGTGPNAFHFTLIRDLGHYVTFQFATGLHQAFWTSVPEVKATLDAFSDFCNPGKSTRRIWHPLAESNVTWAETLGGRKRYFEPRSPGWWTQSRNAPIQGSAGGDILKSTAVLFTRWCWETGVDAGIVNLVHDEIIVESHPDVADLVNEKLGEVMQAVGEQYCPDVPIGSSGMVSDCWIKD